MQEYKKSYNMARMSKFLLNKKHSFGKFVHEIAQLKYTSTPNYTRLNFMLKNLYNYEMQKLFVQMEEEQQEMENVFTKLNRSLLSIMSTNKNDNDDSCKTNTTCEEPSKALGNAILKQLQQHQKQKSYDDRVPKTQRSPTRKQFFWVPSKKVDLY